MSVNTAKGDVCRPAGIDRNMFDLLAGGIKNRDAPAG
jgi:hypothetical protein